jgi:hypothetical protein
MMAAAVAVTPAVSPDAIFHRAAQVWEARTVPAYESFEIDCAGTFLAPGCQSGDRVVFVVRSSDGRSFARTIPRGTAPSKILMQGGFITGPAATPLGFYRSLGQTSAPSPPPNLFPDPLQTIATVSATARVYDVTLAGEESIDGRRCYHLVLRPLVAGPRYPLRALWVDESSSQIVQLGYERPYEERHAQAYVWYRFAPAGSDGIWTIVHIEAASSDGSERVSGDLHDIAFPASAPDWYFQPPP